MADSSPQHTLINSKLMVHTVDHAPNIDVLSNMWVLWWASAYCYGLQHYHLVRQPEGIVGQAGCFCC